MFNWKKRERVAIDNLDDVSMTQGDQSFPSEEFNLIGATAGQPDVDILKHQSTTCALGISAKSNAHGGD